MESFEGMTPAPETNPMINVDLEIVEVDIPGDGHGKDRINMNEVVRFRVKITNNGPFPIDRVTLLIRGLNGATVATDGVIAEFVPDFVTEELPRIGAHGGSQITSGKFKFKAPAKPHYQREVLVVAKLVGWQVNMDYIQKDRSAAEEDTLPKATYSGRVLGTGYDPD